MSKINQRTRILKYIRDFGSITSRDAFMDLGVACLPKRISELKKEGYNFEIHSEKGKNRYDEISYYNRYSLSE